MPKACEHGLSLSECLTCASPKFGATSAPPAQVAHITRAKSLWETIKILGLQNEKLALQAIEAALRDAPQAEPSDPEDCPAWCPRCDGTGDEVQMSDSSPDAHEVTVNCRHCDGVGTLYAAYTGVVRELAKKHQAYIKACGEIYFSKLGTPSAPTAVEPDERAEFEAWYGQNFPEHSHPEVFSRNTAGSGEYWFSHVQSMRDAYEAGRASKGTPK